MNNSKEIIAAIHTQLSKDSPNWDALLKITLEHFDCSTGTLHFLDKNALLQLQSQVGIPEFLIPKLSTIPIGKGMAGIAAERRKPVEMCNLQTDDSGVARPSAKDTKVEGSLAAPLLFNEKLFGTIGIAKPVPYDFKETEMDLLMEIGELISKKLS
ncbi:GAF domain-containing protein [Maribacter sp. 1_MG-2023]|uniref:GAF domain-containing protein n=1 Tax=Maribacter sp. 1_MG-2023 TaxID=3062677 RepID=UPI0026E33691|nr:GAF domain-containing protein [Maribacter sp. 1_MG-2023]MDO6472424.1 GAF domain-containing protein [Maribacter sp. 1_MG-2023]